MNGTFEENRDKLAALILQATKPEYLSVIWPVLTNLIISAPPQEVVIGDKGQKSLKTPVYWDAYYVVSNLAGISKTGNTTISNFLTSKRAKGTDNEKSWSAISHEFGALQEIEGVVLKNEVRLSHFCDRGYATSSGWAIRGKNDEVQAALLKSAKLAMQGTVVRAVNEEFQKVSVVKAVLLPLAGFGELFGVKVAQVRKSSIKRYFELKAQAAAEREKLLNEE